jgi:hypothetical protein
LLPLHGRSAYLGGGGDIVEVVALRGKTVGEVVGVALLFEPAADDHTAGGDPTVEAVSGALQAGLVDGDLLVETGDHGRHVGFPALLGVDLPLRPNCGFLTGGVTVPPAGADLGRMLGLLAGVAGLGQIPDRLTGFAVLPQTAAGVEVGPGLAGLGQGGFRSAQGGGPIRQADTDHGFAGQGRFGVQEGGDASLLVGGQRLELLPGVLGHSSFALTMDTYTHVMAPLMRDAAEAMDRALRQI